MSVGRGGARAGCERAGVTLLHVCSRHMSQVQVSGHREAPSQGTDMEAPSQAVGGRDAGKSLRISLSRKRRLRRNASRHVELDVKSAIVIRGGVMKEYMVLPITVLNGIESVRIATGGECRWLVTILTGSAHCTSYNGAITNFLKDCIVASKGAIPSAPQEESSAEEETQSQDIIPCLKKGRSVFDDGDSDDNDVGVTAGVGRRGAKASAKTRGKKQHRTAAAWIDCQVRGRNLSIHVSAGRQVHVHATQDVIGAILSELQSRAGELNNRIAKALNSPRNAFKGLMSPDDKKRIYWCGCGWNIRFHDAAGKIRNCQKAYAVIEGASQEDTLAHAGQVLRRARDDWNRMDYSDAPRFD